MRGCLTAAMSLRESQASRGDAPFQLRGSLWVAPSFSSPPARGFSSQGLERPGRAPDEQASLLYKYHGRQDTVLEGPGGEGSRPEQMGGRIPWGCLRGREMGGGSSFRVADGRGLAADRAAAAPGATAAGPAAAPAAAAPAAGSTAARSTAAGSSAAGGPAAAASAARAPAARAPAAAAGAAAGAAAAAAAGLAAAHLTAVLLLTAAGEAVPRAAPHDPRWSGRRSGPQPDFPRSDPHQLDSSFYIPSARVWAQGPDAFFVIIYAGVQKVSLAACLFSSPEYLNS